ncbi:hypothetical protein [Colwellia sp. MEBiC06753]
MAQLNPDNISVLFGFLFLALIVTGKVDILIKLQYLKISTQNISNQKISNQKDKYPKISNQRAATKAAVTS